MTPERLAEIRTMAACNWGVSFEDALDLLAALDAAEKDNEALRARLAEVEGRSWGEKFDEVMRFPESAFLRLPRDAYDDEDATPTDGTP